MSRSIQFECKQKIESLLKEYDVSYIDYDAREDDYTIRLEKKRKTRR